MEENLRELREAGHEVPVILGGAALSRHYAEDHLRGVYAGRAYYGKDAFEGLHFMDKLATGQLAEIDGEIAARLAEREAAEGVIAASTAKRIAAARTPPPPRQRPRAGAMWRRMCPCPRLHSGAAAWSSILIWTRSTPS